MSRLVHVAAAQMGPIARSETRQQAVKRQLELMREAKSRGADLVVFPELALTTFFPRWWMEDEDEIDGFYEREMPNAATEPLFAAARKLGIGFYLGYAELAVEDGRKRRFNASMLVDKSGRTVGKYRKVHIPGHAEYKAGITHQHLEKKYFEPGDSGFPVWRSFGGIMGMCICNDRRWPETYRVMALQGVEMVLVGYNTPTHIPWNPVYDHLTDFHNQLSLQAGAYQNSIWVVGVAKAGCEEGCQLLGSSMIVAPSGEVVAHACTDGDELIFAKCDLDLSRYNKEEMFNFAAHRRIEHYGLITERTGLVRPSE